MNVRFDSPYPAHGNSTDDRFGYFTLEVCCHSPSVRVEARKVSVYLYRDPSVTLQHLSSRAVEWMVRASGEGYYTLDRQTVRPPSAELFDLLITFHLRPDLNRLLALLDAEYQDVFGNLIEGFRRHAGGWETKLGAHRVATAAPHAWVATRGIEMGASDG